VSEVTARLAGPVDLRLDALAKVAAMLEWPHGLRWQLGVRLGKAPLVEVVTAPPGTSG
jgi:hypothetical protein